MPGEVGLFASIMTWPDTVHGWEWIKLHKHTDTHTGIWRSANSTVT